MINNNTYNKLEILRLYMLINSDITGILFCTLPSQENKNIKSIEIKNYILYFNPDYIENEKLINIIINIGIKVIQFYFECDNCKIINSFVIQILNSNNIVNNKEKDLISEDELSLLIANLANINIQKQTIIYYAEKLQLCNKRNMYSYYQAINNLSYDYELFNKSNIVNINNNSFIERCQFLFYKPQFNSFEDINNFFNKYIHNFQHFILFCFILRYYFMRQRNIRDILFQFVYQHQSIFHIINIIDNINLNNSFKNIEFNKKIINYFNNFQLE